MTSRRSLVAVARACAALAVVVACACGFFSRDARTFAAPEDAVRAVIDAAKAKRLEDVVAIFGSEGRALIDSSDPATALRNLEVFRVATAEGWQLVDDTKNGKVLVIGNEKWPFPVPLARDDAGKWRFDTAAGKEEVIARRIGRNELAAIRICRTYVAAQRLYAETGHDGRRSGLYAQAFRSDPGRQNGLYWPTAPKEKRSPLGDLVAHAAMEGKPIGQESRAPSPFHGYYFRILTTQGVDAPGGAKDYVVGGEMSGGFALVAWPAQYDVTGVMTFVVNHQGEVHEKDLGPETAATALARERYNPGASWERVQ
jgi:Protein of unknown function (DUF2950)